MKKIKGKQYCYRCERYLEPGEYYKSNNRCKKCSLEYRDKHYKLHREEISTKAREGRKQNLIDKPWIRAYRCSMFRCRDINSRGYRWYGSKGIKLLMKHNDFKFLWFRDKAYLMERPSIDRINDRGNYEISNCRYIELSENISRARRKRHERKLALA